MKYIIDEPRARAIRNFVRCHLEPDPNNDPERQGYLVHSLYLDCARLSLCGAVIEGLRNRFKLRIRFYDESPESPVFFEIKRRENDVILKQRAAVRRSSVGRLLGGHISQTSDLVKYDPKEFAALHRFTELRDQLQARGQVLVSYTREAFVSPENDDVRLTFDRQILGRREDHPVGLSLGNLVPTPFQGVVLELKFTNRFPSWMRELVRTFNLQRTSMGKYVECARSVVLEPTPALPGAMQLRKARSQALSDSRRSAISSAGTRLALGSNLARRATTRPHS